MGSGEGESAILTPAEVARELRLDRKTVYRSLARGTLPALRVGRVWRIRRAEVLALFAAPVPPREGAVAGSP